MAEPLVRLERLGAVAQITLDNPATANAMDDELGPQFAACLEDVAHDASLRAAVLTGAGRLFCGGGNLQKAHRHLEAHREQGAGVVFARYTQWVSRVVMALAGLPQPLVAAVNGSASGAGVAWLLLSDLVICAEHAKLVMGFLAVGLVPGAGASLTLPRLLGLPRAAELLYLNRPLSAQEAREMGLVHLVLPAGEVLPAAQEAARRMAEGPARAAAAGKALAAQAAWSGLAGQVEDERQGVLWCADRREFRRRVAAFFASKERS